MTEALLINGKRQTTVDARDRGLHYGDGLFETLAIEDGRLCDWEPHMRRLSRGCSVLRMPAPDPAQLLEEARALAQGQERAVLKILYTRGVGGRGYTPPDMQQPMRVLVRSAMPAHYASLSERGVRLRICAHRLGEQTALAGIKHCNRLDQVLARAEWHDAQIHEGLLCNAREEVIEATAANLFAVRDGVLYTPDLSACGVAGIMRARILETAGRLGIVSKVRAIPLVELQTMNELFLSNSLIRIWPVRAIDEHDYGTREVADRLRAALDESEVRL